MIYIARIVRELFQEGPAHDVTGSLFTYWFYEQVPFKDDRDPRAGIPFGATFWAYGPPCGMAGGNGATEQVGGGSWRRLGRENNTPEGVLWRWEGGNVRSHWSGDSRGHTVPMETVEHQKTDPGTPKSRSVIWTTNEVLSFREQQPVYKNVQARLGLRMVVKSVGQ